MSAAERAPSRASSARFAGVEGLRAMAALAIVVLHVAAQTGSVGRDASGRLLNNGQIGVTLFFLISGCVLYRPFVEARERGGTVSVSAYARRRFFRIGPPYWVILTLLALWPGLDGDVLGEGAAKFYGFAQIYGHYETFDGIGPAWSLCTEVLFYAVLPLLAWALGRLGRAFGSARPVPEIMILAGMAAASVLFHRYAVTHGSDGLARTLPANLDWFALGMIIALLSVDAGPLSKAVGRTVARPALLLGSAAALFLVMSLQYEPNHFLLGVTSSLVLAPVVLGSRDSRLNRVLSHRWLAGLGLISYSIFLLHESFVRWLGEYFDVGFIPLLGLTLAVTIPLSWLSFRLIESPSMRIGGAGQAKRDAAAGDDRRRTLGDSRAQSRGTMSSQ